MKSSLKKPTEKFAFNKAQTLVSHLKKQQTMRIAQAKIRKEEEFQEKKLQSLKETSNSQMSVSLSNSSDEQEHDEGTNLRRRI